MSLGDIAWHEARRYAHAVGTPLLGEQVALETAVWRRTAAGVRARTPLPPFDVSAMDGWAVAGRGPWRVVGSVRAGGLPHEPLAAGCAVSVTTGAALPAGATAVLRCERGVVDDGVLSGAVEHGQDIRSAGEEVRAGELVVPAGALLDPVRLGLAAAVGYDTVTVVRRPRVRVLVLGDELLTAGPARDGRVRDSLGPQLPGWITGWGCDIVDLRHIPDTASAHATAIGSRSDDADVIVTTGGTSVGPADFVRQVVAESGGELVVGGVDCRPGHPMLLARWPGRWLVGLPGNPHAAVAALMTLLDPLLLALHGVDLPPLGQARLTARIGSRGARTRLVPCTVAAGLATPTTAVGSGMLRGLADADGLAVVPGSADAGDLVDWLPLPWASRRG